MRKLIYKDKQVQIGRNSLEEIQAFRQEQNKGALAAYLSEATVEFNGKRYGVTEADQNEMQAMIMQYQMLSQAGLPTTLEWHAKHEECTTFTIEQMVQLVAAIKAFVLPHMSRMQEIKARIYQAETVEEVMSIEVFAPTQMEI